MKDTRAIAQRAFRSSRTRPSTSGANDRTVIMPSDANASVNVEQPIPPPGSVYPGVEPREEWEDTQGVVDSIDEAPVPDLVSLFSSIISQWALIGYSGQCELADIVNGDDLGFIMNIGFDASPLNDVDPLQFFVADKLLRPGPQP